MTDAYLFPQRKAPLSCFKPHFGFPSSRHQQKKKTILIEISAGEIEQGVQAQRRIVPGHVSSGIRGIQLTGKERRIADHDPERMVRLERTQILMMATDFFCPGAGFHIGLALPESGGLNFNGFKIETMLLGDHQRQQSRSATDVQYTNIIRTLRKKHVKVTCNQSPEQTGIGAHFHGNILLVNGEMPETEIWVGHN
jgi:hypothetical protein